MRKIDFESELSFQASRGGGKGGQNVNKVSTKIELSFDIVNSMFLKDEEKNVLLDKLKNKVDKNGVLRIVAQKERSQYLNKLNAIKKFYLVLEKALKKEKIRHKTNPTLASKEERLTVKKIASHKKLKRSKDFLKEI
ncbi:MAG: alternative ribosome rescue aminoacyl-tRNA hydrolase ArfB [Ignavibacteriae bacterium]|nr:alternative ribosome rescue aminoacyl-tRNA hydrolase ArfB [Ignavibacteriota bacterium]